MNGYEKVALAVFNGLLLIAGKLWLDAKLERLKAKFATDRETLKGDFAEAREVLKAELASQAAKTKAHTDAGLLRLELRTRPATELRFARFGELATRITKATSVLVPAMHGVVTDRKVMEDAARDLMEIGIAESCWLPSTAREPVLRFSKEARALLNEASRNGHVLLAQDVQRELVAIAEEINEALRHYLWGDENGAEQVTTGAEAEAGASNA